MAGEPPADLTRRERAPASHRESGAHVVIVSEGGGARTHDLEIKSLVLYQLSYAPSGRPNVSGTLGKLKSGTWPGLVGRMG